MTRRYSEVEKAEAVARSLVVGPTKAAEELSIPVTTLARWARTPDTYDDIKEATKEEMAAAMWKTVQLGTARLAAGLQEPGHKLGDVARAVEVASRSHALLTGGATERTEVLAIEPSDADYSAMGWLFRHVLDRLDPDARWAVEIAVRDVIDAELDRRDALRLVDVTPVEGDDAA